jgi:valyl-tRNA synthetase
MYVSGYHIAVMEQFPSTYDPTGIEQKCYDYWLKQGLFTPEPRSNKPPYTIMIPLPNVTGRLTLGHALNNSIQDILIRYKKLTGYETLWMMGMDHAGIATQVVVEGRLLEQGIKKEDLGREKFVQEVWKWKDQYANIIRNQLKKMGFALDWSREQFTLSDDYSKKVIKVFVALYKKGWIYRGEYIVNWCPRCLSALSDEQVETEETAGWLYYIKYPLVGQDTFITIATTRPETMLGDTAVCVHPDDQRYQRYIGSNVLLPIMDREIPIIADEYVDPEFGTGALKVTPSHDQFDFSLAKKHGLEFINIMNPDATLNENTKTYNTMDRYAARERVIKELQVLGLLDKTEKYRLPLATCERCHTPIEPRVSRQWFVKMKELSEPALRTVAEGAIRLHPNRWTNLYNHWLENVRDWCISRQLWWGHRIPVYYCTKCYDPDDPASKKGIVVSARKPQKCRWCGSTKIIQDPDVLDTWFSSWLWPFATLGWPNKSKDYKRFYPTQTLVTGWDIIYLWVARMIMAGFEFTGKKPFSDVLFHPMIRDEKGRKMSKSLGNSPDPMDLIDRYGADALRFGIQLITPREQDVLFSEKSLDVGRKFCNKLWNASRLIRMNHAGEEPVLPPALSPYDIWILGELNTLLLTINDHFEKFELNAIARELYDFVWHTFCDWYLEIIKIVPASNVPTYVLKQLLIMLHPFIPFITEEIYQRFEFSSHSIFNESWPESVDRASQTTPVSLIKRLIEEIRNVRGLFNIHPKERLNAFLVTSPSIQKDIENALDVLKTLAGLGSIEFSRPSGHVASIILPSCECYLQLSGIDLEKEKQRLAKEIDALSGRIEDIKYRLNNPRYIQKAGEEVKLREQHRLDGFIKKKEGIERAIEKL